MSSNPPNDPHRNDEVLSFLDRVARFLRRLNEGIVLFIFHRVPKWTYETIKRFLTHFSEYFDWLIRVSTRLGWILVLLALLIAIVLGPPIALSAWGAPILVWLVWGALITFAILYAFQRYVRKELERRRRERQETSESKLICSVCHTAHNGPAHPVKCSYCGSAWADGTAGVHAPHGGTR